jgi:hypothetical protein
MSIDLSLDLETLLAEAPESLKKSGVLEKLPELQRIAEELFVRVVSIKVETDPELPERSYVILRVRASGDITEILRQEKEWYRRTLEPLGDDFDKICLSIDASSFT